MLTREALDKAQEHASRVQGRAHAVLDQLDSRAQPALSDVAQGLLDLATLVRHTVNLLEPTTAQPAQPLLADQPPVWSVAVDVDGDAWQRRSDGRWYAAMDGGGDESWCSLRDKYSPVTVVYRPKED